MAFALLEFVAHAFVPNAPKADSPVPQVVSFLRSHHDGILASTYLDALAVCLLVVAAASLVSMADARHAVSGLITMVGVTLTLGLSVVVDGAIAAGASTAHRGGGDAVTLSRLADGVDPFFAVPGVLFMTGLGFVLLRSRIVPGWLAGLAIAIAVIRVFTGFASLVSGSGSDEAAFLLSALWTIALGVTLLICRAPGGR